MNRYHAAWLKWALPHSVLALTVWALLAFLAARNLPAPWDGIVAGGALAVPISLALAAVVAEGERRYGR